MNRDEQIKDFSIQRFGNVGGRESQYMLAKVQACMVGARWTDSKKVFAYMYIDDSALGIPLKYDEDGSVSRPYVDWVRVEQLLKEKGVIDFDNNDYLTGNNSCVY